MNKCCDLLHSISACILLGNFCRQKSCKEQSNNTQHRGKNSKHVHTISILSFSLKPSAEYNQLSVYHIILYLYHFIKSLVDKKHISFTQQSKFSHILCNYGHSLFCMEPLIQI